MSSVPGDESPPRIVELPSECAEVRSEAARGRRHRDRVEIAEIDEGSDEVDEGDQDELGVHPQAEGAQQGLGRSPELRGQG